MTDHFTGFTPETFDFLKCLAANNTKEWFAANKATYDAHIVGPSLAFIDALRPRIEGIAPGYTAEARLNGSFRRIYRDVRFSKDKTPYNPRIHLIFWSGDHPLKSPAVHLVIHPDSFGYGAGMWGWSPAQLSAFRDGLSDASTLEGLHEALAAAAEVGCRMGAPDLKNLPKGFEPTHPAADMLRYKSLVARTHDFQAVPPEMLTDAAADHCVELIRTLSPINSWLKNSLKI